LFTTYQRKNNNERKNIYSIIVKRKLAKNFYYHTFTSNNPIHIQHTLSFVDQADFILFCRMRSYTAVVKKSERDKY
jgi:hypothetical protein